MLKVVFSRKIVPANGYLRVTPGVYIEDPSLLGMPLIKQADAINRVMSDLSPYLCQYFYDDNQFTKRPALTGVSALLLKPDDNRKIYLRGAKSNTRDWTALLRKGVSEELAQLILPIEAVTVGSSSYSNTLDADLTIVHAAQHTLVSVDDSDFNHVMRRLGGLHIQKPAHAIINSILNDNATDASLLTGLYLVGANLDSFDIVETLKSLYTANKALNRDEIILLTQRLSKINSSWLDGDFKLDQAKKVVTDTLMANWTIKNSSYSILWGDNEIGGLAQLARCHEIRLLNQMSPWVSSTQRVVNGYKVPAVYESVSPHFPAAIAALMPERHGADVREDDSNIMETALKRKPYALGGLYFHDNTLSNKPRNSISKITTSLNDICGDFQFNPAVSTIDLNQDVSKFESFAFEIANKACLISIPGFQLKAPVSLTTINGEPSLSFAGPENFTHIIKFPSGKENKVGMVYSELYGMMMARSCGVETAIFRAMPTNQERVSALFPTLTPNAQMDTLASDIVSTGEPAYITELFDRSSAANNDLFMNEDFLSASKEIDKYDKNEKLVINPIHSLYHSSATPVSCDNQYLAHGVGILAETLKMRSTNYDDDSVMLYRQLIANVIIGNGDAHLKNFSILHKCDENGNSEVRLSPAYDILATRALCLRFFKTQGVCMLGNSYSPSREEILKDGVQHFGFSNDVAKKILDETLNNGRAFIVAATNSPSIKAVFNNTKLGLDVLSRSLAYSKIQVIALSENALDHTKGADDKLLFEAMYPDEDYELVCGKGSSNVSSFININNMPSSVLDALNECENPSGLNKDAPVPNVPPAFRL